MQLFVHPGGDDENDGLTPESPLATIAAAEDKLPARGRRVINFAPGIYEEFGCNVRGGSEWAVSGVSYRGGPMAPRSPAQGPQSVTLEGAAHVHDGRTKLTFASAGWAPSAHLGWFLRIIRDGKLVIFEIPAARNGSDFIDIDVGRMLVNGPTLASMLQPGDICEWVQPAVEFRSQPGGPSLGCVNITGCGAGFSAYSETVRGGVNGHTFERIAFSGVFSHAHGVSYDRCRFEHTDNNWLGGSAFFVNCSSRGLQLQGSFAVEHDQPSARPDSPSSPIHQGIDDPSMELLVTGKMRVGRGGAMSALGASYVAEKNVSIYDAGSEPALSVYRGSFIANPPSINRNRIVAVQGDGNGVGVRCVLGGLVRVNLPEGVPQVTGAQELSLEGANAETWAAFGSAPINGNIQNHNGRITTAYPS